MTESAVPSRKTPLILVLGVLSLFGVASVCRSNLPSGEPGAASAVGSWKVYDLGAIKIARWETTSSAREAHAEETYAIAWPFASRWKEYRKANKATG